MASTAIVIASLTVRGLPPAPSPLRCLRTLTRHLAAVIVAARFAQMMGPLEFAAIRAFGVGRRFQGVMRTPHIAARGRGFLLWDGHGRLFQDRGEPR